jgi:diaminohydroxyphosphoribosylaminopyrimidine deaminase/5-amino-6-(5-phosphoribosylamino)uracil reductase
VSSVGAPPGIASHAELVWLARARALAQRARGRTSPNPLVGAIVARDGRVVGEGWHEGPGTLHGEAAALAAAGEAALGATLVVTLEPCSHHGRTPPCTDAILRAGVARVVYGCPDPLEAGRGRGARILAGAGLSVVEAHGPEGAACRELNAPFLTWAVTGRPSVTLKLATSLDGKVATASGESQWISGPEARALVHRWRADSDAVAVGIGTALADDPRLTARDLPGPVRQPLRVVFDSEARLPPESKLARGAGKVPVLVVAGPAAPPERVTRLQEAGVEVLRLDADEPPGAIAAALDELGRREVQSLMVEGGARLAAAFVGSDAVDRVTWVLAPILLGGADAPGALADVVAPRLQGAPRLVGVEVLRVGEDMVLTGRLRPLAVA